MTNTVVTFPIYLEIGKKRVIAGALDWPGWCRSGRDEAAAGQALLAAAPRYAEILHAAQIPFQLPLDMEQFTVVERLSGTATTDYGVPDHAPAADHAPFDAAALARAKSLLTAYWQAFDRTIAAATGKALRKGPRGGGRELDAIVSHVVDAEKSYLTRLGWKGTKFTATDLAGARAELPAAIFAGLTTAVAGELPKQGPRGGVIWLPHYYVRRSAWHLLDHLWEIEDRVEAATSQQN